MTANRFTSLACFVSVFVSNAAMAQTPRVVQIVVSVESAQFRGGLGDARRTQIEAQVAAAIATELAKPFPIIEWRAIPGADVPAATLTAAVTERQVGDPDTSDPETKLVWRAKTGGGEFAMPNISSAVLYSPSNGDRPIDDFGGKFRTKLDGAALAWVNSETNQKQLKELFLKHVLIANLVMPAPTADFVMVPLPWQGVKLHRDSVLRVEYVGGSPGAAQQMEFTLTRMAPRLADPMVGDTQTLLGKCLRGGDDVPQADSWEKCVAPLNTNPPKRVSVYADPYLYDAHPEAQSGLIVTETE